MVESLPKLHHLFTIVTQRENVPRLRIAIFHLEHRFRSAFLKGFLTNIQIYSSSWCLTFVSWSTLTTLPGLRACSNNSTLLHRLSFQSISWTCNTKQFFPPQEPGLFSPSIPPAKCHQSCEPPSYLTELAPPWPSIQNQLKTLEKKPNISNQLKKQDWPAVRLDSEPAAEVAKHGGKLVKLANL